MTNKEAIAFLENMIDRESIFFGDTAPQGDGYVAIWQYHVEALQMSIKALSTDAVDVVRCKDCRRWCICRHGDDWFCADGERRSE